MVIAFQKSVKMLTSMPNITITIRKDVEFDMAINNNALLR
jgi:hypothetical protein